MEETKKKEMEKAKEFLELSQEDSDSVSRLTIHPHRVNQESRCNCS